MRFQETATIALPADRVFALVADQVESLVPFLPNVASIRTDAREARESGRILTRRAWQALPGSLPTALRPFFRPEMMRWTDISLWDQASYSETWHLETERSKPLYTCTGFNTFRPDPDAPQTQTLVSFSGDLNLIPNNLVGVPRIISHHLAPQAEAFIIKVIRRNFREVIDAMARHDDARKTPSPTSPEAGAPLKLLTPA